VKSKPLKRTLIDAGPIVAYYSRSDHWHIAVTEFLSGFRGQFITTTPVVTEALWLLGASVDVQNELLVDLAKELYQVEQLDPVDFAKIADLNTKYRNVPADFADLSLIVVSERLGLTDIVTLDSDFDIYRRLRNKPFKRLFPL
jgi:predicted nucleic acid-binding protein